MFLITTTVLNTNLIKMPYYISRGQVPHKRHTVFRKPNGDLYSEELVSTEGFSDVYSLIYHAFPPTFVKEIGEAIAVKPEVALENNMQHRSFLVSKSSQKGGIIWKVVYQFWSITMYISVWQRQKSR